MAIPPDQTEPPQGLRVDRRRSEFKARCTICRHSSRAAIELGIARGASLRAVAAIHKVSSNAVWRHWHRHVSDSVKAARQADTLKPGADLAKLSIDVDRGLLEDLQVIRAALFRRLDLAVETGNDSAVALLTAQLLKALSTLGKQTGELREHASKTVTHLVLQPDYLTLRVRLVQALRAHPEALRDVAEVLRSTEATATAQMGSEPVIEGQLAVTGG
jgi:hypothetical protein